MPRRTFVDLEEVAAVDNLAAAFWRAARGKRDRPEVAAFAANLDAELARMREEVLDLSIEVGRLHMFEIRDPKPRTIHAPCFHERVLHHAMMALIGPVLERSLVDDTFACRAGKGPLAAVLRAQRHSRRYAWYLKFDVRAFFATIAHDVLRQVLRRRLKGRGVLTLCDRVIGSYAAQPGRGLPIGALTSQHFANVYLSGLDRYLLEDLRVRMVRYMDDVVCWHDDKAVLRSALTAIRDFAGDRLRLEVKPDWQMQRSVRGLPFCGFRVFPRTLRLSRRRQRRYSAARRRWETAYALGLIDGRGLQTGYASAFAITAHADAVGWRREELRRRPAPEV